MDLVTGDGDSFDLRDWSDGFEKEIVEDVLANSPAAGRAIIAPGKLDAAAGDVVRVAQSLGFEVRVLSSPVHYVVYGEQGAVLREEIADGPDGHRLTRRDAAVT